MIHGLYGAQQFAKKLSSRVNLPAPMSPVLHTSDAGLVIATDSSTSSVYILFRGTLFDYEWKHDFDFIQTPTVIGSAKGKVHKGFQKMYLRYQPHILSSIKKYQPKIVNVAGHSLGAALTILTAFELSSKVPQLNVYTFASPKLGDGGFVSAFNALPNILLEQYINEADLVPLIPLTVMPNAWEYKKPLFYEHIQQDKMHTFYVNNKSWQNNHSLALHMAFIDGNVLQVI
jgi:hypothetical protein